MPTSALPSLTISHTIPATVRASGVWQVHALAKEHGMRNITSLLRNIAQEKNIAWDLSEISAMDHIGAQLLWNAWGKSRPPQLKLTPKQENFFGLLERVEEQKRTRDEREKPPHQSGSVLALALTMLSMWLHHAIGHVMGFLALIGQLTLDLGRLAGNPRRGPWKEISANIYHIGFKALGITALVGLLIGVVLSYLSAQQLHSFGGDIFLVNILGMSIIRELGPLLAAILVAGRSGSAITAQLGVMRVTEELDAMLVMGLPHGFRLVLPRTLALAIAMPLLVIWTDAMALLGGMLAAKLELGFAPSYFLQKLPNVVSLTNYWIGIGKGIVFGSLIALVACHFGLRIKANTESLGQGTTTSVVTAITIVIIADAIFAIMFSNVGY